jgi:hypothetical protein
MLWSYGQYKDPYLLNASIRVHVSEFLLDFEECDGRSFVLANHHVIYHIESSAFF